MSGTVAIASAERGFLDFLALLLLLSPSAPAFVVAFFLPEADCFLGRPGVLEEAEADANSDLSGVLNKTYELMN